MWLEIGNASSTLDNKFSKKQREKVDSRLNKTRNVKQITHDIWKT